MEVISLYIADQFTTTPGPRLRIEGEFSGEQFRDEWLEPKYKEAVAQNLKLFVDLDGTEGYGTSFLEEAFGGLARKYDGTDLLTRLEFKSEDEPYSVEEILRYIREARKR
jgi:hypothetical protein